MLSLKADIYTQQIIFHPIYRFFIIMDLFDLHIHANHVCDLTKMFYWIYVARFRVLFTCGTIWVPYRLIPGVYFTDIRLLWIFTCASVLAMETGIRCVFPLFLIFERVNHYEEKFTRPADNLFCIKC